MEGQRIRQARLASGLSLDDCVVRLTERGVKLTKPALSNYEKGKRAPTAGTLRHLAAIFHVQPSYFIGSLPNFSIEWYSYRAKSRLGQHKKQEIQSYANHQAEIHARICFLFPETYPTDIPKREAISSIADADGVAARLRKRWKLGLGSIDSVTHSIEAKGAMIVHYLNDDTTVFDGFSALVNKVYPLILVNNQVSTDRLRFDLLHELGHILMDTSKFGDDKREENAAHRFASSMLLPPEVIKRELGQKRPHLTLSELLLLKEKYGISVAALIISAWNHGIINDLMKRSLQIQLSSKGWRKMEPDVFKGNEKPTKMRQLVTRAVAEGLLSLSEACDMFSDFRTELIEEFPTRLNARKIRELSKVERNAILQAAAKAAVSDYENNRTLVWDDAEEPLDY
jgi:Zn-dependent peptidase ImmA (M78 family)